MAITYLSGERIQGSSTASGVATPTYDTTFSSSSNWTLTDKGSSLDIDTGNSKLTFSLNASNLDDNIRYDLQHADALDGSNVDNSEWIIRFKLKFDNINDNGTANQESPMIWFGIGDTANPSGRVPSGDYLRFGFGLGDDEIKNKLQGINGGSNDDDNTNNNPVHYSSTSTTPFYYCEIQRVSATSATFKMRTGSHSGTQVGSTITNTLSAGSSIINLRYLSIYTYSETMSGTGMTGYITDLEFYNNVDSTTTTIDEKATITNVPAGTRFEETDTRKIFRRELASSSVTGVATPSGLGDYCMDMTTNGTVYRCTDVMVNPGNYSWSTWFYPSNTTEEMAFFKHWSAGGASTYAAILAMAGSGDGSVFSFTRSGGGGALYGRTAASAVTTGKWNLITVSYQTNDTINIFVNGNDNTNYSGYPTGSAGGCNEVADWAFGASGQAGTPTGAVEDLLGYVCDTASWNVALTYANHQTMWNSYNQNTNVGGALATTVEVNQIRGYWSGSNAGGNPVNEATGSASEGSDLDLEQNTGITSAGTTSVAASWKEKGTA